MLGLKIVKHLCTGDFSVKLLGLWKNRKIYLPTPASLTPPLRWEGSWLPTEHVERSHDGKNFRLLFRLPTPLRGGVLARGAGCRITAIKHFIPMLGIKCSQHGNNDNLCKMSLQNNSFTHFLFILFFAIINYSFLFTYLYVNFRGMEFRKEFPIIHPV